MEIVKTLSQDWQENKNAPRYSLELSESFVTIPDPLSNPLEALRGGIHTVDEILSPTNDLQDNGNGVMMVNPNQNPLLRMILRDDAAPNNMPHPNDDVPLPNSPQLPPYTDSVIVSKIFELD